MDKLLMPAEFSNRFRELFHAGAGPFFDTLLSIWLHKPTINIVVFNEYLIKQHGDYEAQGLSMLQFVEQKYGNDAAKFLQEIS